MKPIKYVFKSLFNNAIILEGRKRKWHEALIVFLVAMVVALVPSIVATASVKGSAILEDNTNSVDVALVEFSKHLAEKDIKITVTKDKTIEVTNLVNFDQEYFSYKRADGSAEVERLKAYIIADKSTEDLAKRVSEIQNQVYNPDSDKPEEKAPITSYLLLGKESAYLCLYAKNATAWNSPVAVRYMTYEKFEENEEVITNYLGEYALDSWKSFINTGYAPVKLTSLVQQTGVFACINVLVALFMSLMIFVITRGKRNPYRDYKFTEALKIVGVASLSPALISLLLGFILSQQFSTMLFMVLLGLRVMWMSSKNLNPAAPR